ncbi:MAG: YkgJ family cysteine cluster protein [Chitinispirillaceae bacterium]|nr:YkgJ family cysteine cluster protein [Chitinispirillaceae bacterium]
MSSPCASCAEKGTSCCTGTQILLTSGDVKRITAVLLRNDYFHFEKADEDYLDPGDDPIWIRITIKSDGTRRVVKRSGERHCSLLGPAGCRLALEERPLVCRLYPVAYTTDWIDGIDPSCPIAHAARPDELLNLIGTTRTDARRWHRMLMNELFSEYDDTVYCGNETTASPSD